MATAITHLTAALRVCVDSTEGGRIGGRVFSRRLTAPLVFSDIGSLLLQMEEVLDAQKFPRAFERTRSFLRPSEMDVPLAATCLEEGMPLETMEAAQGEISTFELTVLTRRNTTWQGSIDWLDGSEPLDYSSVLELIKLTDRHVFTKKNSNEAD